MKKNFARLLIALMGLGFIFNLVQIIIIINGQYNQNPAIESEFLRVLDSIALTVVWAVVNLVIVAASVYWLRRQSDEG